MYCVKNVTDDVVWVGASDRRLNLFENLYPVPDGVSYNSYVILDQKTALIDTTDAAVRTRFLENVEHALGGRDLDYLVINHMEPDHCATLMDVLHAYPEAKIVANAKIYGMISQFFGEDALGCTTAGKVVQAGDGEGHIQVKAGDTLSLGKHILNFAMMPMVHWPEVMAAFDSYSGILFSADAFGTFGALSGNIFADYADEAEFERKWVPEARRYYSNIVGKYGVQVDRALKTIGGLGVKMICPLHGPIWRKRLDWAIDKYRAWAAYEPENSAVMIAYSSVYGHTENVAEILAAKLGDAGVKDISVFDVSVTDPSYLIAEAFRCDRLVFAATTYNAGLFPAMLTFLTELRDHGLQNRKVAIIENGSWAPAAGKIMREIIEGMKNMDIYENILSIKSALSESQLPELDSIVDFLV